MRPSKKSVAGLSAEMDAIAQLPLSVLVPTRNSMALLPKHVETLRRIAPAARELVVVDSDSTDGTVELIKREFPRARILKHPPGLYESWNFGINACASEFVYISTVGDSIGVEGLRRLTNVAREQTCDVVVSPPQLIDEQGRAVKKSWPIFELLAALKPAGDLVLGPEQTLLFTIAFLRKAILGSSASNLYRVDTLRQRPFPTDFGHAGDVGWGLRHGGEIRLGIVAEPISTFVFHPRTKKSVDNGPALRLEAARSALAKARSSCAPETIRVCDQLCEAWQSWFTTRKSGASRSIFNPSSWWRREARGAAAELERLQESALALIARELK